MSQPRAAFFERLFRDSLEVVASFPLTVEPPRMAYISEVLAPAADKTRSRNPFDQPEAGKPDQGQQAAAAATGLNTVGMLLDRLSILAVKHWNLRERRGEAAQATELEATQVAELVEALASARPGHSSINNKMTSRTVDAGAADFASAYFGLLTTNLLLWEAQEILYNHDILSLPCEELRAYIEFFSRGNLSRNVYIESSDALYWRSLATS